MPTLISARSPNKSKQTMASLSKCRLATNKKKEACSGVITLKVGQLEKWCVDNNSMTDDDCTPFIVNYEFIYTDEEEEDQGYKFRLFISSKCLMRLATSSTHICVDGIE